MLINIDSLIFLAKPCPPSLLFGSFVGWWDDLCYCYDDVWGKDPSGTLWIFLQRSWRFPPMYSPSQVRSPHWNQYMAPLLLTMGLCPWGRPVGFVWCYACISSQVLSMLIELLRNHIRCSISVLPQTWWSPAVDWMKACLKQSTKVLFQRIYWLLNDTTEWEIYTKL